MLFLTVLVVVLVGCWAENFDEGYVRNVTLGGSLSPQDGGCVCTTVPCPVAGDNYLPVGNGAATGLYHYVTHNNIPVVYTVSMTITKPVLDNGSETTSCTQEYSRDLDDDGKQDCDAGHILAHRLGGPGNQPINIFPQAASVNRGVYAQFENLIYDCVFAGDTAKLSWSFKYSSGTRTKPDSVVYTANFSGGNCVSQTQTFDNKG